MSAVNPNWAQEEEEGCKEGPITARENEDIHLHMANIQPQTRKWGEGFGKQG